MTYTTEKIKSDVERGVAMVDRPRGIRLGVEYVVLGADDYPYQGLRVEAKWKVGKQLISATDELSTGMLRQFDVDSRVGYGFTIATTLVRALLEEANTHTTNVLLQARLAQ